MGRDSMYLAQVTSFRVVLLGTLLLGCPHDVKHATALSSSVTWREACVASLTRAEGGLSRGTVNVTRTPETTIRLVASTYEVVIREPTLNSDFDDGVTERPWTGVGATLQRRHRDRDASIEMKSLPTDRAAKLASAFQSAADACLVAAEGASSHDDYFVGTITGVEPLGHADFIVSDAPTRVVAMHVDDAGRGAPFRVGSTQRFAVSANASLARAKHAYWLRREVEGSRVSFVLAQAVAMIDEADKCPDVDAGAHNADDGCP